MEQTDATAILGIIKEEDDRYLGILTGQGFRYLPPLLPMFRTPRLKAEKARLQQMLVTLSQKVRFGADTFPDALIEDLRQIGRFIFTKFGVRTTLELLMSLPLTNLIVFTDDPSIPWIWAYDGSQFLCERFACGKLFVESVSVEDTIAKFAEHMQSKEGTSESCFSIDAYLNDKRALILAGFEEEDPRTQCVKKEVDLISEQLTGKVDVDLVVNSIFDFWDFLEDTSARLKLFHYAGHIEDGGLFLCQDGVPDLITADKVKANLPGVKFSAEPIIFLNGCRSGYTAEAWAKGASLATVFLDMGATSCVTTVMPVTDEVAYEFAASFYRKVVNENESVGEALRQTRLEQAQDEDLGNDLTRLFFELYGDPRVRLSRIVHLTEAMGQQMPKIKVKGWRALYRKRGVRRRNTEDKE